MNEPTNQPTPNPTTLSQDIEDSIKAIPVTDGIIHFIRDQYTSWVYKTSWGDPSKVIYFTVAHVIDRNWAYGGVSCSYLENGESCFKRPAVLLSCFAIDYTSPAKYLIVMCEYHFITREYFAAVSFVSGSTTVELPRQSLPKPNILTEYEDGDDSWEYIEHGTDHAQYWPGVGTGNYEKVYTGYGDSELEAIEDLHEQIASVYSIPSRLESDLEDWKKNSYKTSTSVHVECRTDWNNENVNDDDTRTPDEIDEAFDRDHESCEMSYRVSLRFNSDR